MENNKIKVNIQEKPDIKSNILMISLEKFYSQSNHMKQLLEIIDGKSKVSLRIIDWFVTNYSKKKNISFIICVKKKTLKRDKINKKVEENVHEDSDNKEKICPKEKKINFLVFQRYKAQLKAYSKKRFDPFCRKDRITNWGPNKDITTTIGQLNFFKWAIENNILKYIKENIKEIESDMNENVRKHNKSKKKDKLKNNQKTKRKELSKNASKSVQKMKNMIVIDFD